MVNEMWMCTRMSTGSLTINQFLSTSTLRKSRGKFGLGEDRLWNSKTASTGVRGLGL